MSEHDDAERTEEPTEKKLRDSRAEGQVPRSRDLATAGITGAVVLMTIAFGGYAVKVAGVWMTQSLTLTPAILGHEDQLAAQAMRVLAGGLVIGLPVMFACVVAGLLSHFALGGFNFSSKAIKPDFSRLSPLKGFGRLVSANAWVEVAKGLVKFVIVGGVAAWALLRAAPELARLALEPDVRGMGHGLLITRQVMVLLLLPLLAIALFDVPWQWWSWRKRLRMSREEVKREHREAEGSPETKGRVRRVQHEMARKRMMEDVPRADLVLVNPTHYAVALRYDRAKMRAPQVVAKGVDEIAMVIREIAGKHKIPVVSAPPLARALYKTAEVGQEVPVKLYQAVAQMLTYIYQLRTFRQHGGREPVAPKPQVDEEN
jgi:flagellar biosynthesis protein FlhB